MTRSAPALLRTECQTCGEWAEFVGRTRTIDGRRYAVAFCTRCDVEIPFWTPDVERLVAPARAQLLRAMATRVCAVATGTEQEIRSALALPTTPPPLDARECVITAGVLSRASVELRFLDAELRRADLDTVFGQAGVLPRTGPGAPHNLVYDVRVSGAPACVSLFASFSEQPQGASGVRRILLRIDPAMA